MTEKERRHNAFLARGDLDCAQLTVHGQYTPMPAVNIGVKYGHGSATHRPGGKTIIEEST